MKEFEKKKPKPLRFSSPPGSYKAQSTSFFLDPVAPKIEEKEFEPEPVEEPEEPKPDSKSTLGFEVKSFSVDESKPVVVEGIKIMSCSIKDLTVYFETEAIVRASNHQYDSPSDSRPVDTKGLNVLADLEISPILTIKKAKNAEDSAEVPDLIALELGAIPNHMQKESTPRVHETRLDSVAINLTLTHAFTIEVKSLPGLSLGNTLVSLTIRHSNSHAETVSITNIALHPGHSRYKASAQLSRSISGAQYSVSKCLRLDLQKFVFDSGKFSLQKPSANMTNSVQWGFAPKTELSLPLVLGPRDAYSTILKLNAGEEMRNRSFISPISVTGVVRKETSSKQTPTPKVQRVVVAAEAYWATEIVAVEPVDAFKIEMRVERPEVKLGEPMVVSLRIFNLGLDPRDLMLLMAKDEQKATSPKDEAVNTAVVSEVSGYTFGVWGISGEDDGTVRLNRDDELLAVDAALLLGEVMGQHAVDAELRFVPLREGSLRVPNWKLYDRLAGEWYTCSHNLGMVAKTQ